MVSLRETFAQNLKEKRKKCGFSQANLAEKVDVSTHHIAMIEITRNFPTPELMERIASALNIEIHELFIGKDYSPNIELEQLRKEIRGDVRDLLTDFLGNPNAD